MAGFSGFHPGPRARDGRSHSPAAEPLPLRSLPATLLRDRSGHTRPATPRPPPVTGVIQSCRAAYCMCLTLGKSAENFAQTAITCAGSVPADESSHPAVVLHWAGRAPRSLRAHGCQGRLRPAHTSSVPVLSLGAARGPALPPLPGHRPSRQRLPREAEAVPSPPGSRLARTPGEPRVRSAGLPAQGALTGSGRPGPAATPRLVPSGLC